MVVEGRVVGGGVGCSLCYVLANICAKYDIHFAKYTTSQLAEGHQKPCAD